MRRKLAAFLVICMMLQVPCSVLTMQGGMVYGEQNTRKAEKNGREADRASSSDSKKASASIPNKKENTITSVPAAMLREEVDELYDSMGGLQIDMKNLLGVQDTEFYLWLEPKGRAARDRADKAVIEDSFSSLYTNFMLDAGKYVLHLENASEDGIYLPYSQEVEIRAGRMTKLCLANDYPEYHNYDDEARSTKQKIGVLTAGNFAAGDETKKSLEEEDLSLLLDAIDAENADLRFDLNGDRRVDLLDLECFSRFYKNSDQRKAVCQEAPMMYPENIQPIDTGAGISDEQVKKLFSGQSGDASAPVAALETHDNEPVSEDAPIEVAAVYNRAETFRAFAINPKTGSLNAMEDGEVIFEAETGETYTAVIRGGAVDEILTNKAAERKTAEDNPTETTGGTPNPVSRMLAAGAALLADRVGEAEENEGAIQAKSIVIDLGRQIPVKKVTIRITSTMNKGSLVEISRVEFLNQMEDHIPEPDLSIPDRLKGEPGDAQFTVSWRHQPNVTGYKVKVSGETVDGEMEEIFSTEENTLNVQKLNGKELSNNESFSVKVRSVNGDWASPYSDELLVETIATKRPEPPEQISIKGGYQKLTVSWKKMKSTYAYNLYYREKTDAETPFISVEKIRGTTAELTGLKENTEYELYLTGENQIGVSDPSERYSGRTISITPPVTPNFKLLNVPKEGGGASEKILSVNNGDNAHDPCDEFACVDGRFETVWVRNDWDAGCSYETHDNKSPVITFDQPYTMDTVVIIPDYEQPYNYSDCKVIYWDEENNRNVARGRLTRLQDKDKIPYYEFIASEPFTAKKLRVAVTTGYSRRISYAELKFYDYYDLEDRIFDMYTDTLHIELKEEVTEEMIHGFEEELEYVDPVSGEKTPRYAFLKQELENALELLQGKTAGHVVYVDTKLTKRQDRHINFSGGLNTWQPLGVTGLAGDTVILYIGSEGKIEGENANVSVIATQYHGESSSVYREIGGLKIGANTITIPQLTSMSSAEAGGQLYLQYNGNYNAEKYAVRVAVPAREEGKTSAAMIPVLSLYNDLAPGAKEEGTAGRLTAYLEALNALDPEAMHNQYHASEGVYNEKNCIFNATDIAGGRIMLSLPATQVRRGLNARGESAKEEALEKNIQAMDQMMTLFYQHKGLSDAQDAASSDRMPVSRINIRYQRMFEGAFMYAGGQHIGIEYGSASGMLGGNPMVFDENGKRISGKYYGWGIYHEIGHEINEGAYAVAEVTNNYYAQLAISALSQDTDEHTRWKNYDSVYKKVTSGTKGPSANGAVQLAMYWQLRMAYDRSESFTIYPDDSPYQEQFDGLFFARMDSYARNTAKAPAPGGVKLTLNGDKDNNLMRLGCAAAQKNILEFFERWGMEPDSATRAYAGQFEQEERAIWLAGDNQRNAVLASGTEGGENHASVSGELTYEPGNRGDTVEITLSSDDTSGNFFGFEVFRIEQRGEETVRRPVGFARSDGTGTVITDTIRSINNRAFTYEAVGYDIWLYPTEPVKLGQVRVSHNGGLDSAEWTAVTNMVSTTAGDGSGVTGGDGWSEADWDDDPDAIAEERIGDIIDGNNSTTFTGKTRTTYHADGTSSPAAEPEIILYLGREETLTGFEYCLDDESKTPMDRVEVYLSSDGQTWDKAAVQETSLTLEQTAGDGTKYQRILFTAKNAENKNELRTYDASMVKFTAPGQAGKEISVSEIVLLGQTGDRVDLEAAGIGVLAEDYENPKNPGEVLIPKGSLIFTGTYAGNPAYNTVLLWDDQGEVVGGYDGEALVAEQFIFAEDPGTGNLLDIADGHWVYVIPKERIPANLPKRVRAELYRVDDAITQEGQRLVSSTVYIDVPNTISDGLPEITLQGTQTGREFSDNPDNNTEEGNP